MKIIITTALVLLSLFLWFSSLETVTNSFKDYEEMAKSGIIDAGWLPPYLPKSAVNIEEEHDIDTNVVYARFEFNPDDDALINNNCSIKEELEAVITYSCKYRSNNVTIKMFKKGYAELFSQPNKSM